VVAAAGEQVEAGAHLGLVRGLGQDAAADGDDGVGREDELVRAGGGRGNGGLFGGDPPGIEPRDLGLARGLVDVGGCDAVRDDADLRQEREAAGARRSERQACDAT